MRDLFFLIHWFLIPLIILFFSRIFFGGVRFLSFPIIYLLSFFVLIYLQALNIYFNYINELNFILSVWIVPLLYVFTCGLLLQLFKHDARKIQESMLFVHLSSRDILITRVVPVLSAFFICLPFVFILDKGVSNIALFHILAHPGDTSRAMELRIGGLVSNYSSILTLIYSYSRALLYPLYITYLTALTVKGIVSRLHFMVALGVTLFFSVLTTAKAPLAYICFGILVSYYFTRRGYLSKKKVSFLILFFLFLPALFYPLLFGVGGVDALEVTVSNLWRRLTWVPSYVCAVYFDAFTNLFHHVGFSSNRFLAWITGSEYIPTAAFIYDNYFSSTVPGGLVDASYFASFYADWGMIGTLLGTVLVAAITAWLQILFDCKGNDLLGVSFRAVTVIAIVQLMQTNIYSSSLGRGFISAPILLIVISIGWSVIASNLGKYFRPFEENSKL